MLIQKKTSKSFLRKVSANIIQIMNKFYGTKISLFFLKISVKVMDIKRKLKKYTRNTIFLSSHIFLKILHCDRDARKMWNKNLDDTGLKYTLHMYQEELLLLLEVGPL